MRQLILLLVLLYSVFPLHAKHSGFYTNPELDELHIEFEDLKASIKSTQTDLTLLEERIGKQDHMLSQVKGQAHEKEANALSLLSSQANVLEKKLSALEKTLDKATADLRSLSSASTQAFHKIQELEQHLLSHEKRLDEIVQLKGTLTHISKAIGQRTLAETPTSTTLYRVKAGDSLEKIARNHKISVETLRKINHLSSDKIVIGQDLKVSDDPS